jgi:quinol-cytochrome oxidoreductase complex cytochrome b subunit
MVPSHVLGIEGERLGVLGFGAAALFLVMVPFLDRRASRGEPSRLFTFIAAVGLVYLVTFTIVGRLAK